MIDKVDSKDSLKEVTSQVFLLPQGVPSSLVSLLMKKAGDLHSTDLVSSFFFRHFANYGYTDTVTSELIDQFSRYGYLEGIARTYSFLSHRHIKLTSNSYQKFLLSLLPVPKYKRVCMNITKEMLLQSFLLSKRTFFKSLSMDGVSDADMVVSLLSITNAEELSIPHITKALEAKMKEFSLSRREISVWELYKYLCILAPTEDRSHLAEYLTQSIRYFLER